MISNASHPDQLPSCPLSVVRSLFTVVLCLITFSAVIGNTLVTAAVARTPWLRTSTNYFIINMAMSDLLGSLTNWPLYATDKIISDRGSILQGTLASMGCRLGIYIRMTSHIVSIFSLVLIAVDRFIASVIPLKATMVSGWMRVALITVTWIVSVGVSFPVFYHTKIVEEDNLSFCKNTWDSVSLAVYYLTGFFVIFLAPLVIIIVLYSRIMKTLRKRTTMRDNVQTKRRKQNRNIMKLFKAIVVAFFVCWTPFCAYMFLKIIYPALFLKDACKLILGLFYYVLPSLSTTVNPFILFFFSTNFREAMKNLYCRPFMRFTCKCRKFSRSKRTVSLQDRELDLQNQRIKSSLYTSRVDN